MTLRTLGALAGLCLCVSACDPAAGQEVAFRMELRAETRTGSSPSRFTTAAGWDVTLTKAVVVIGPVYLYENAPPAAQLQPWWRIDRWLIPVAHAHVGDQHFNGGRVLGEWVDQRFFDALGPTVELGSFTGTAATSRAFSLRLDPPRPSLTLQEDLTQGHHAWVEGTATRQGETVTFAGGLTIAAEGTMRRVDGLPLDAPLTEGGLFTLTVHPDAWLDDADFAALPARSDDGAREITTASQPHAAWMIAIRGARGFTGTWSPAP